MLQANTETVQAAAIVRSFIVGFRYFRQPAVERQRILDTMRDAVLFAVNGSHCAFSTEGMSVNAVVEEIANQIGRDSHWALSVCMLAAPFLVRHKIESDLAKEIVVQALSNVALLYSNQRDLYVAAYAGNRAFSEALNQVYGDVVVFDEDSYPGCDEEVPELPEMLGIDWLQALVARRAAQYSQVLNNVAPEMPVEEEVVATPARTGDDYDA